MSYDKKEMIKSINAVYVGRSPHKGTPYIRLMCILEDKTECSWTGWLTSKNQDRVADMLAVFKMQKPMKDIIAIEDAKEKAQHFTPPNRIALVNKSEVKDKVYYSIEGFDGMTPSNFTKEELSNDWHNFDLDNTFEKSADEVPF